MNDQNPDRSPVVTWRLVERQGEIGRRRVVLHADAYDTLSVVVLQRAYAYVEMRETRAPRARVRLLA